jgi:hypothetical protein
MVVPGPRGRRASKTRPCAWNLSHNPSPPSLPDVLAPILAEGVVGQVLTYALKHPRLAFPLAHADPLDLGGSPAEVAPGRLDVALRLLAGRRDADVLLLGQIDEFENFVVASLLDASDAVKLCLPSASCSPGSERQAS